MLENGIEIISKPSENQVTGKIITKQFQGKEYHYAIEVEGKEIVAHVPIEEQYNIGEEVALQSGSIRD